MNWQEYQEAVCELYTQAEGIGVVERNLHIPDRVTGQKRQVDGLLTLRSKGHAVRVLLEAKFHSSRIDVKDIEETAALCRAVGADKAVLVVANGWTEPAYRLAQFLSMDLRLLTIGEALDLIVQEKWKMCPHCGRDCIVLDSPGAVGFGGVYIWWLAGRCRSCRTAHVHCQDCGEKLIIEPDYNHKCYCGYVWRNTEEALTFQPSDEYEPFRISPSTIEPNT